MENKKFFHVHLVSDATGETLEIVARAAAACFHHHEAILNICSLVRSSEQLDKVVEEIEQQPGIVLFTLLDADLRNCLENKCNKLGIPAISVLDPVIASFSQFLNEKSQPVVGRQHDLDAHYFNRIEALDFSMAHDDGRNLSGLNKADIVLIGISRTSKTPTSIYLANRGYKVANIPIVPQIPVPKELLVLDKPMVIGLLASTEAISQIRRQRLKLLKEDAETDYVDRQAILAEIRHMKTLCKKHDWPIVDVTRKSIEETSATILKLLNKKPATYETKTT